MTKKLIIIFLCSVISLTLVTEQIKALVIPPGPIIIPGAGPVGAISIFARIAGYLNTIRTTVQTANNIADNIPHQFTFGGPILSSEGSPCTMHVFGFTTVPFFIPFDFPIPLPGTTMEVGPPVATPPDGAYTFPFISDVYDQHTEGREGPWSLALGFTPFPPEGLNTQLATLFIQFGPVTIVGVNIQCDSTHVILKLGTSKEDVTADALQRLRQNFPGFPWP